MNDPAVARQFQMGDLIQARGREWIILGKPADDVLRLRPLSGSEKDAITLVVSLEEEDVRSTSFAPPTSEQRDRQDAARMLADALRLSLRRGAGPFRSAAHLGVEPRAYQLVPLLMAMRQDVKRLLIADDVGIGKTVEAGMILREMLDRGEIGRFSVLCPPHLVDQWVRELAEKFNIDAVAVTSARARALERSLAPGDTLFAAYPYTVVSLDYIKADSRRISFAHTCPECVVVDEAHSCVGGNERGTQQRFALLEELAKSPCRHLLLLTATPHSGNQDAYARLLGLLHPDLAAGPESSDPNAVERYRRRLAQHFVQRRRADIIGKWEKDYTFPTLVKQDISYELKGDFQKFQKDVLAYCVSLARNADGQKSRRLAFWSTLALMRCVGSSPAAALSALRNRQKGGLDEQAVLEPVISDRDDGDFPDSDLEPAPAFNEENDGALRKLIREAEALNGNFTADPKFRRLVQCIDSLLKEKARPVIFCRFIKTAEAVGAALRKKFRDCTVEVVTGNLPPEERRERVEVLAGEPDRILVATDCLSEGINLQTLFNAVIHYDLNWNPTRHQQRDGRIDRFGQTSGRIWSLMMFGENSIIDGAVIKVIRDKMERIQRETGVVVPVPEDSESVSNALMQAMLLHPASDLDNNQGVLDLGDAGDRLDLQMQAAGEAARHSQTRYAQAALQPGEVLPEWRKLQGLLGGPEEVSRFVRRTLSRLDNPLGKEGDFWRVNYDRMPPQLRERLKARHLEGEQLISFDDRPASDVTHVGRTHPLVAILAETMAEGALDPTLVEEGACLGRAGAWRSRMVDRLTIVLLLRLRFKLVTSGRHVLLAEEATALAFVRGDPAPVAEGGEALALLEGEAAGNLADHVIARQIDRGLAALPECEPAIADYAARCAARLSRDHDRMKAATRGEGATTVVEAVLPVDVIGFYVLVPE